jgi:hypothetical protein
VCFKIFIGLTEDKNIFVFGNDKTLTPFPNVLKLLGIHDNSFITKSYQPSRLVSKRHVRTVLANRSKKTRFF